MKKATILILFISILSIPKTIAGKPEWHFGIHTGLDVGGAIPWPVSAAIGNGDKMDVVPKLSPALGLSLEYAFASRWALIVEMTYKTVGMDASIVTLNSGQKFRDEGLDVTFYGRAKTSMTFTMLEIPLYLSFKISGNNRVYAGGYWAYVPSSKFVASAIDGRIEAPSGEISIVTPSSAINQDFSENISSWDAGWFVGYERRLFPWLTLSGRISMGLKDIFKSGENYLDYGMVHMRGTIMLSYRLF